MWRTFYKEYEVGDEFDEFLNQIEADGYIPMFLREHYYFKFKQGVRVTVVEALVTARKKDA